MQVRCDSIFIDEVFNSRGFIAPIDVASTAKSIAELGLLQPIIVRAMPAAWQNITGKKHSLVAGFRRYTACSKVLLWEFIEATVHENMSDEQAYLINFAENLERKDLSLMQEVKAVLALKSFRMNRATVAERLNKSPAWVQLREQAATMSDEVQKALDKGELTQQNLRELYVLRDDPQAQLERAKKLRAKNMKQLSKAEERELVRTEKKNKLNIKRSRSPQEIEVMQDTLRDLFGNSLTTRVLGWCGGFVSDVDIHLDIKKLASESGKVHTIPEEIINAEYAATT